MSSAEFPGSASFSADGRYRHSLTRMLESGAGCVTWVMLNPSSAGADQDDPTVRKVRTFSAHLEARKVIVVNLYDMVSTDPDQLKPDSRSEVCDDYILAAARESRAVVCAWGAHRAAPALAPHVVALLQRARRPLLCLGTTKAGHPKHPLYLANNTKFVTFPSEGA